MNTTENNEDQKYTKDTAFSDPEQEQTPVCENTGEEIKDDIIRDEEDVRNSRIAVILLWIAIICSILLVILAACFISGFLDTISREFDRIDKWGTEDEPETEYEQDTEYQPDIDYEFDLDSGKYSIDINVDDILSQFDAEGFEEALSRDIEKMKSENNAASSTGEGTAMLDFCDNEELNKFAKELQNQEVTLFIYRDGDWYDTSDKEDVLKAFNAIQTVKIGEEITEYNDSEWLEIDFYDGQTDTSWDFDFWDGCFEWKKDGHYNMYKVTDWGDLEGLTLDTMGLTLDDL